MKKSDQATEGLPDFESMYQSEKANSEEKDAKITELTNDLQRTRADFENYRRQVEMQKEQYGNVVKNTTVAKLLPLLDDIDRAIAAQPEVLAPLAKNLDKTLKSLKLKRIECSEGTEFNPELHNAVTVEGDGDNEVVAECLCAGYYYEDEVLRPAMVKVAKK